MAFDPLYGVYILVLLGVLAGKLVLDRLLAMRSTFKDLSYIPCRQLNWFHPNRSLAAIISPIYPGPSKVGHLYSKFALYKKYGSTVLSSVVFWRATPVYWIADADALKIVTAEKHIFGKDTEVLEVVNFFGTNLLSADGPIWKRHRIVANPAFNEATIASVWSKSNERLGQWFAHLQTRQEELGSDHLIMDLVPEFDQLTLSVFLSAAYGLKTITFSSSPRSLDSQHVASRLAYLLTKAIDTIFFRALCPYPLAKLSTYIPIPYISKQMREINYTYEQLKAQMLEFISAARESIVLSKTTPEAALLRNLVEANMNQEGEYKKLTDEELLSNVFIFYIGGHETVSHTLSLTLTMLAFYPDIQRKLYEEVKRVWPNGSPAMGTPSTYKEDYNKLVYTQAVLREVLRHNPIIPRMNRPARKDWVVPARRFAPNAIPQEDGCNGETIEKYEVHIPKGSVVMMDIEGTHMNPIHWGRDAAEFKPDRFIDTDTYRWPRDAFLAFSSGPRQCIGTRFGLAESTAMLANIVYSYEISLLPQDAIELKKMEQRGAGIVEQMRWLCAWVPGCTRTPTRTRAQIRKRAEAV